MHLTFLSPEAALIGLAVAAPVVALTLAETRARAARVILRLPPPLARGSAYLVAIVAFAIFVSVGAAQPILKRYKTHPVREDAAVLFVIDTSKSMQAAPSAGAATRFDRARRLAKQMRGSMSDVPAGLASLTDRVLLHLFPSPSTESFNLTLDRALDIERPASTQRGNALGTSLDALAPIPSAGYFQDTTKRRVIAVFSDAETLPFDSNLLRKAFRSAGITAILVRVGSASERVYQDGVLDPNYRPPVGADETGQLFADLIGGFAFDENELAEAIKVARTATGRGPHRARQTEADPTPLASYAFALAFLPLGFLLWRRNLR